ncbi:MAG: hypothetical protein BWY94_00266 [Actinobacteria bacterium ADurb.BinA094]|nr:MAG: hypothetical protein BWY94_00266 [Actinobacteria bacterium ADurb.BinA094]
MRETAHRLGDLSLGGDHIRDAVEHRRIPLEVCLVDPGGVHLERQLHERLDLRQRAETRTGLARDRLDEPDDAVPVPAPAPRLTLQLPDEELLALHAGEVAPLVVAEADEVQRLLAAHQLVAGLEVDGLVVGTLRDEVLAVDGKVDAAQDVDRVPETGEVGLDPAVDREAGELFEGPDHRLGTAVGVGRVHLLVADTLYVHTQVTGQREHRDAPGVGVETQQHLGVRAPRVVGDVRPVGADEQDVHRLVRQRRGDLRVGGGDLLPFLHRGLRRSGLSDGDHQAVGVPDRQAGGGQYQRHHHHGDGLDRTPATEGEACGGQSHRRERHDRRPQEQPAWHRLDLPQDVERRP